MKRLRFLLWALAMGVLTACVPASYYPSSTPTVTPVPSPTKTPTPVPTPTLRPTIVPTATPYSLAYVPEFEEADCEFSLPFAFINDSANPAVVCGYLRIPENRIDPDSKFVLLHVAIFKAQGRLLAKDPLVYLAGGPGIGALENLGFVYDSVFRSFLVNRDVIVFDQRGTGFSKPSMRCPEVGTALRKAWESNDVQATNRAVLDAVAECRDSLIERGLDITAYNSAANAADLEDLREALGYESWNLYGSSYGTRLALTAMRDHPGGIRKVILDATYPLDVQINIEFAQNLDRVLLHLFDACQANPECDAAFPNLQNTFYSTVSQLNQEPVVLSVPDAAGGESEIAYVDFVLTGGGLMQLVFQSLYHDSLISILPRAINEASEGRYNLFRTILGQLTLADSSVSWGMHYAVECHEEVAFESRDDLEAIFVNYPHLEPALTGSQLGGLGIFGLCDTLQAGAADPIEALAVNSDIPTLILAGEFDPITPPRWGQQVADQLSDSRFFLVPGAGHGVGLSTPCMTEIAQAFLNDLLYPSVWDCTEDLPPVSFRVPLTNVVLQNYTDYDTGYRGRRPVGWDELSQGFHQLYDTILYQAAFPVDPMSASEDADLEELFLNQLTSEFSEDAQMTLVGEQRHNQIRWTLYEAFVNDQTLFIAVGFDSENIFIVLMNAPFHDRDALYEQVFLPVLAAFKPID